MLTDHVQFCNSNSLSFPVPNLWYRPTFYFCHMPPTWCCNFHNSSEFFKFMLFTEAATILVISRFVIDVSLLSFTGLIL